jgi:hypothetical protein
MDRIHVDRDLHDSHDLEDATNVVRWTAIVCDLVRLCLEHESDRIDAMSAHVRSSECLGHHRLEETIMNYTDTQLEQALAKMLPEKLELVKRTKTVVCIYTNCQILKLI